MCYVKPGEAGAFGDKKTAGVIISEALRTYRNNFVFFLITSLIVYGSTFLLSELISLGLNATGIKRNGFIFGSVIVTILTTFIGMIPTFALSFNAYDATLSLLSGRKTTVTKVAGHFRRDWLRCLGLSAWETLWIMLWGFVFLIPAFVKIIAYSFAPYLMIEYPGMPVREALRLSNKITKGYKLRLFALYLAFYVPAYLLNYLVASFIGGVNQLPDIIFFFLINLFFLAPIYYAINTIAYMDIRPTAVKRKLIKAPPKPED